MNLILLVIDTLRYDYVGANGNDQIRTPNLDALAAKSWVFDRAFACSYPTIPHRTDVMTGEYGRPFNAWMPLRFDVPTLPRILAELGCCTQLIHDTPHLVNGGHNFDWPFHAWTFVRGAEVDRPWIDDAEVTSLDNWAPDPLFDYVDESELRDNPGHVLVTYSRANRRRERPEDWNAARLFRAAADWLRDNARRESFFLWLDCFDPHEPWDAPAEYVRMYDKTPGYDGRIDPRAFVPAARKLDGVPQADAVRRRLRAFYAAKVSWVDHCVGQVLRTLAETGLEDNTAVIVTADHGTNLGDWGKFGKGWPVHETEGHVPLIVHVPGRGGGRSDIIVQPQDLFATALGVLGEQCPEPLDSHDVLAAAEAAQPSPREVALAGRNVADWQDDPDATVFTVFAPGAYLLWSPRPESCRLFRYGSADDTAAADPDAVQRLWQLGLDEIARRGTDPRLVDWLSNHGQTDFPKDSCQSPAPNGYRTYWQNSYMTW